MGKMMHSSYVEHFCGYGKSLREPWGEEFGMYCEFLREVIEVDPSPVAHFGGVRGHIGIVHEADEHGVMLVFCAVAMRVIRAIDEGACLLQGARKTHFFAQPAHACFLCAFVRKGVTAARVRPKAGKEALSPRAALEEEFLAAAAEDIDREGAVEEAGAGVGIGTLRMADFFPIFIGEDHGWYHLWHTIIV